MQDYVEAMCNRNEQEELEAEFYYEHGITLDEYIENLRAEYEDSFSDR